MKPRGGEGQNGRLKCPMGFLVFLYFEPCAYCWDPVMDWHPIQDEVHVVILLVTLCWLSCDGLAYHPVGVVVLPVAYRAVVVQFYPWFNF